ncbi:copper chaperone PCu(A)C [Devosia sp. Naph2]|uniref:copper chaperone PCu(A)C n=1 Tax=Devosia polycyclovorans TaxID=3345148 RepID=UPI0035CFF44C
MKIFLLAAAVLSLPTVAHAEVTVTEPWSRASILASRPGAAYLTLASDADDLLIKASSAVADEVIIHAVETDGAGITRMKHAQALEIPAGQAVAFEPGSMHLMLMGLHSKLVEGSSFPLTLVFESGQEITVEVPVLGPAAAAPNEKQP